LGEFSPFERLFTLAFFQNHIFISHFWLLFPQNSYYLIKYGLGYILGDFFKKASGHPAFDTKKTFVVYVGK
jgi:hypothetical protein